MRRQAPFAHKVGDDPTLRDRPPMPDEELLGRQLRGLLIFAAAVAVAIVLAACLR